MMGGRHTVRALSQEVWSARTGGRKPSPLVGSQGNLRAISTAGQRRLPWWWNDPETRAWVASGACCCPSCRRGRRLIEEDSDG